MVLEDGVLFVEIYFMTRFIGGLEDDLKCLGKSWMWA